MGAGIDHRSGLAFEVPQDRLDLLRALDTRSSGALLFGLHFAVLDHILLENEDGFGHIADLVTRRDVMYFGGPVSVGELAHFVCHADGRFQDCDA